MPFIKGMPAPPRRKSRDRTGCPNKSTAEARRFLDQVMKEVGGWKACAEWAKANPSQWWPLYIQKTLPNIHSVAADIDGKLEIVFHDPRRK